VGYYSLAAVLPPPPSEPSPNDPKPDNYSWRADTVLREYGIVVRPAPSSVVGLPMLSSRGDAIWVFHPFYMDEPIGPAPPSPLSPTLSPTMHVLDALKPDPVV
jgi:hypothetical protein